MLKIIVYMLGMTLAIGVTAQEQDIDSSPPIRVQLKPKVELIVSSEIAGRLSIYPLKEGERFNKGVVLAGVNCDVYRARLDHAKAKEKAASQKYKIAKRLNKLESISVMEVGQSEADLEMATSERQVAQLMVKRCIIRAPFSGRVSQRFVESGEYVTEGKKLLEIYSTRSYEVELIIPSRWVNFVNVGDTFQVTLDETGNTYQAKIIRLGSVIDALSQSYKVFGEIQAHQNLVLMPGMSGSAVFNVSDKERNEHEHGL
ncbi:efflux RND transporter periplasmic adaptor subunit [Vibrio salinus]|uniref:efflux RND transporter periplasmic adaptor subunit n=1 Tax=Vibrio salinus TaxID=2899784 RepID=UPI001E47C52D|nr:efflux RND transporter periplasmic adaptor subunit [Vibrio salinus]MCE0495922.1 efflux RND transporter periplasmic adaptor subunit [Vibrio salinus]